MCYYCHRGIKMKHEKITQKFILLLEKNESLKMLVEKSLEVAKANNPDKITNPAQTLDELYEFLDWSVKCMPWECLKEAKYKNLFTAVDQATGYFWFIFDQPLDELKDKGFYYPSLQYLEPIASWIKEVVKSWGKFLSTKQSWKEEFYQLALSDEKFGLKKGWYGDKNIWKTYNDFFSRKLIDTSQRPISDADVVSPADAEPKGFYKIDENSKMTGDNSYLDNLKNNKQKLDELKSGLEKSLGRNVYNFEIKKIKNENFLVAQSTILGEQTSTFTKHYLTVIDGASLGLNAFYHGKNWKDFPHYELERIFFTMKVPQEKTISKQQSTSINNTDLKTNQNMDTLNSKALYKGFVGACSAAAVMIAIFAFKFIKDKFSKKD